MKTQIIQIENKPFMVGILEPGHHPELWVGNMINKAPKGTRAVFINKVGKQSDEFLELYREAVKNTDALNWSTRETYLFELVSVYDYGSEPIN